MIFRRAVNKPFRWNGKFQCTGETNGIIHNKTRGCFEIQTVTVNDIYLFDSPSEKYFFKCPNCGCFSLIESSQLNREVIIRAVKISLPGTVMYERLSDEEKKISDKIFGK